ncbi:nucleotidyltransferase [Paenibacillus sp. NPDC057934]|uniref:SMODS domain-containing nucleotidyltransferase n=1 Tax=Paenibacillus sp. NPDC057934 TaxID=3346282 RepID=UPI0036DD53B7
MKLTTYFNDFLSNIRLTKNQVDDLIKGHKTLRERLEGDDTLSKIIVSTFLQGSYRRSTAVKPKSDQRSDVDVIVVTKLVKDDYTPDEAMKVFEPFMEKYYKGKYRYQGRSIGIEMSYVDLDVVITSAPSEAEEGILETESVETNSTIEELEAIVKSCSAYQYNSEVREFLAFANNESEWKTSPLHIPDRSVEEWKETHPLEQIRWTWNKNASCNGHYINVVKSLKWWKRVNDPGNHPKSYPLEHLIGQTCPDHITSVAEGVTFALEAIVSNHPTKPFLADHGVPEHDVFARITDEEYDAFYKKVQNAATIARQALDAVTVKESANKWIELFGSKFPSPPADTSTNSSSNGFSSRTEKTTPGGGRFA